MLVFIDFVEPSGRYRPSAEPAFAHPEMPAGVLCAAVFLDAAGAGDVAGQPRIFHVERGQFIDADSLGGAGVGELDTLIIVNCERVGVGAPDQLSMGWHAVGGVSRRLLAAGIGADAAAVRSAAVARA